MFYCFRAILHQQVEYALPIAPILFQIGILPIVGLRQGLRFTGSPVAQQTHHNCVTIVVQVFKVFELFVYYRQYVILIIVEIRCSFVRRDQSYTMLVLPMLLITYLHIASELFALHMTYRHRESNRSVRRADSASVAIGLLQETLVDLNPAWLFKEGFVPTYGREICSWQNHQFLRAPQERSVKKILSLSILQFYKTIISPHHETIYSSVYGL